MSVGIACQAKLKTRSWLLDDVRWCDSNATARVNGLELCQRHAEMERKRPGSTQEGPK